MWGARTLQLLDQDFSEGPHCRSDAVLRIQQDPALHTQSREGERWRERERERQTDRQTEREREREFGEACIL